MRVAVLWEAGLCAEGIACILRQKRVDVVLATSSSMDCLVAVREGNVDMVVAECNGNPEPRIAALLGAAIAGSFRLVAVAAPDVELDSMWEQAAYAVVRNDGTTEELVAKLYEFQLQHNSRSEIALVDPPKRGRPPRQLGSLTRRELEVARLIAKEFTNRKIAEITGISEHTVKSIVASVLRNLACEDRTEVAARLEWRLGDEKGADANA